MPSDNGRPSIADIARASNTSTATVSRVLNGKPDVSEETRERVLRVLRDHGYRPRIGRVAHDGIGVCFPDEGSFRGFYFGELLDHLTQAAFARDCTLTLLPRQVATDADFESLARQQRLLGILFVGNVADDAIVAAREQAVPHVVVDRPRVPEGSSAVLTDIAGGIVQAVEYLVRLGHERITLLNGPRVQGRDGQRIEGFRDAFRRSNLRLEPSSIVTIGTLDDRHPPEGATIAEAIARLGESSRFPTAMIGAGEWVTLPALIALMTRAVRVPHDLSYVAFHDAPSARYFQPPLTVIRQPIRELAELAVDTLVSLASGRRQSATPVRHLLPMELVIRESTGLAPARS